MNNNENPNSGGEEVSPRVGWLMVVSIGLGVWAVRVMPQRLTRQANPDGQDG